MGFPSASDDPFVVNVVLGGILDVLLSTAFHGLLRSCMTSSCLYVFTQGLLATQGHSYEYGYDDIQDPAII